MHNCKPFVLLSLLMILLGACSKPLPKLEGVDLKAWKEDRNGCQGYRTSIIDAIDKEKEKLKALSEMDLIELLGRPDENQLLERNQKFFIYLLEPGPGCDTTSSDPRKLILRINAMSLTKETLIR